MAMTLKMQQQKEKPTTKPLSPKAIPFSPSSSSSPSTRTSKPNYLLYLPHQLYPQPPSTTSPPAVVLVRPPAQPVFFYTTVRSYTPFHDTTTNKITPFPPSSAFRFSNPNPNPYPNFNCFSTPVKAKNINDGGIVHKISSGNHYVERKAHFSKMGIRKGYYRVVNRRSNRVVAASQVCENGKAARVAGFWEDNWFSDVTTVMVRNIPNKLRRDDLLAILDEHCRKENENAKKNKDDQYIVSAYDFLYLPIDFLKLGNKGYAFVNFTSSVAAARLRRAMKNKKWDDFIDSKKLCDFSVARIQGLKALVQHFNGSKFPTKTEAFLPVVLKPAHDGMSPGSVPRHVGKCFA